MRIEELTTTLRPGEAAAIAGEAACSTCASTDPAVASPVLSPSGALEITAYAPGECLIIGSTTDSALLIAVTVSDH